MFRRFVLFAAVGCLLPALSSAQTLVPIPIKAAEIGYVSAALDSNYCYRASSKFWYSPSGSWVYTCYKAPDSDSDGCYEWSNATQTLLYDGDYTIASSCDECTCSDPCFPDPNTSFQVALRPDASPTKVDFRLDRLRRKSESVDGFEFPRSANRQIVVWPQETPSFIVRIKKDESKWWDVKLFPTTVVMNRQGRGGDPAASEIETLRLGFQIEPLGQDELPTFTTSLESIHALGDQDHDAIFDGLYELRLGRERFFVRMKDDPA